MWHVLLYIDIFILGHLTRMDYGDRNPLDKLDLNLFVKELDTSLLIKRQILYTYLEKTRYVDQQ